MQNYELAIVISGQLPEDLAKQITDKTKKIIEEDNGKVISEDFWGRRRLAYKIKGQDHGYYNIFVFSIDPAKVIKIEAELKMIAEVIRYLLIKKEEEKIRLVKAKKEKVPETKVQDEKPVKEEAARLVKEVKEDKEEKEEEKKEELKKGKKTEEDQERLEELDKKIDEILND